MYSERRRSGGGFVIVAILIFVGVAVWWLESRFGADVAIMVIGGLFGVICFAAGGLLIHASNRSALETAARFNESLAITEKHRQMTMREHARGDAAWDKAHAQLAVMDAKRIDQIAQQRAGLLVDLERQQQKRPQWDAADDGEYQTWE